MTEEIAEAVDELSDTIELAADALELDPEELVDRVRIEVETRQKQAAE